MCSQGRSKTQQKVAAKPTLGAVLDEQGLLDSGNRSSHCPLGGRPRETAIRLPGLQSFAVLDILKSLHAGHPGS